MVKKNPEIAPGLNKHSSARTYHRTGRWAVKNKVKVEKTIKKVEAPKPSRFYPGEDIKTPIVSHKTHRPARLRQSITPGTVLIVLAGPYKGKRVVFLKQLPSGLLLVTGPFKINGIPLRRMNQAYVIATQTKMDVSAVKIPADLNEKMFEKEVTKDVKKGKKEEEFFEDKKIETKKPIDESRKAMQKTIDEPILKEVKNVPYMWKYLNAKFSLTKKDVPHLMKF